MNKSDSSETASKELKPEDLLRAAVRALQSLDIVGEVVIPVKARLASLLDQYDLKMLPYPLSNYLGETLNEITRICVPPRELLRQLAVVESLIRNAETGKKSALSAQELRETNLVEWLG